MKRQIRLDDRFVAMDLLAEGKTIEQVVEIMTGKHSDWSVGKVRSAYFPSRGYFAISRFEGASRREINKAKERLLEIQIAQQKRARENLERLNRDPSFTAKRDAVASRRMTALQQNQDFIVARDKRIADRWKNPVNVEAQRQRMIVQCHDSQYMSKLLKGAANSWTPERRAIARDTDKLKKMIAIKRTPEGRVVQSRLMSNLNRDPEFRHARLKGLERFWTPGSRKIASLRMTEYNLDPEVRKDSSLRLIELNKDWEFQQARLEGIAIHWGIYRQNKLSMLEEIDIHVISKSRRGYLQLGHIVTPVEIAMAHERKNVMRVALAGLETIERRIISLLFFARSEVATLTVSDAAVILEISVDEATLALRRAIDKLSRNKQLSELL